MMLRASISTELVPRPIITGVGPTGVEHGALITAFVDAVVLHDEDEVAGARRSLEACVGKTATDRVALIAGNFSMMNRALDAVGAPIRAEFDDLAEELGVTVPFHLAASRQDALSR